jgi:hypothetical protein
MLIVGDPERRSLVAFANDSGHFCAAFRIQLLTKALIEAS